MVKIKHLCVGLFLLCPLAAQGIDVIRFGAVPNDGKNDREALQQAINECRKHPGSVLRLAPGVYNLRDDKALEYEYNAINGVYGDDPQAHFFKPDAEYVIGLDLDGLRDVTIEASGAVLLVEGWYETLAITHAQNLTIKGLVLTHRRPPFTEGTVVRSDSTSFDMEVDTLRYPLDAHRPWGRVHYYDPRLQRHYIGRDVVRRERIDARTFRLHTSTHPAVGDVCILRYSGHTRPAILIKESAGVTLRDVTIHSQPGMGVVGHRSENIRMYGLRVVPAAGAVTSTNTDATHFTHCRGEILFDHCAFGGQGDDCTNVHNYYWEVEQTAPQRLALFVRKADLHALSLDYPDIGDTLALVRRSNLSPVENFIVREVTTDEEAFRVEVEVDKPFGHDPRQFYLTNLTRRPSVVIRHCTVSSHLARAFLLKTRDIHIADNVIVHSSGSAIQLGAEAGWRESGPVENALIERNRIVGCGYDLGTQRGSAISVEVSGISTPTTRMNRGITIRDNDIDVVGDIAIYVAHATDVEVADNRITGCKEEVRLENVSTSSRWQVDDNRNSISWLPHARLPHYDHIEMSGQRISVVLRYGVEKGGAFVLERSFVWPMLRTLPNDTHGSLMRRWGWNVTDMIAVNGRRATGERVERVTLDGILTVHSSFAPSADDRLRVTRYLFPSVDKPVWCEKYVLRNTGSRELAIEVPASHAMLRTDPARGVDGEYDIEATLSGAGRVLGEGDSLVFYSTYKAGREGDPLPPVDVEAELWARKALVAGFSNNLVLETPDTVINTLFDFAKTRAAESIYKTKGDFMHSPGGESYYAAIWANDQAEYVNPFFPFLGYDIGNRSAYNSFMHFARYINADYRPIPSSIIAEGLGTWNGAGDRGDAAMVAYGAARYALASGNRDEAKELWPLIEWCLEYCRRKLNASGVVASDTDELEHRFPAGEANLCTSSLYYDALRSAVYLGKDLGKPHALLADYSTRADALRTAIERYFGAVVEGFHTYRYYEGNDVLRSWICIPLTVGIYDRKDETLRALFSPRLWTSDGLLTQAGSTTFWDRSTLYALRGVLACGATERGLSYLRHYSATRLLGEHVPYPIEAWPEGSQRHLSAESGLYVRIITEGLFGIRPTGLRSFAFTPRLPKDWNVMALSDIHAFGHTFDLRIARKGTRIHAEVWSDGRLVRKYAGKEGATFSVTF
jgi:hypothetical protein